jgi:hypothetical protein
MDDAALTTAMLREAVKRGLDQPHWRTSTGLIHGSLEDLVTDVVYEIQRLLLITSAEH